MRGFRLPGGLQHFISVFSALRNLLVQPHKKKSVMIIHIHRLKAMAQWKVVTSMAA